MSDSPRSPIALALLAGLLLSCGDEPRLETVEPPPQPDPAAVAPPAPAETGTADGDTEAPETPPEALPTGTVSDKWYAETIDGQHSGWRHVVWTHSTYEGKPSIRDHTEVFTSTTRDMAGVKDKFDSQEQIDVERSADGELWWMRTVMIQSGRTTTTELKWTGDGYDWVQTVAGQEEKRRIDCEDPATADGEAFMSGLLADTPVLPGSKHVYLRTNFLSKKLDAVNVLVEATETLSLPTGAWLCYRVRETVRGQPTETLMWVDSEGVIRKFRTGRREMLNTTRERAKNVAQGGYQYSITIRANPYLPRCTSLDKAVVEVDFARRKDVGLPDFPESPFSREVSRDGNKIRLELTAHDDPTATVQLPVTDPELAPHLESTNLLCADAPSVQQAMKDALGGETDGRKAAQKILDYVFSKLRRQSGPIPSPTAAEILEDGRGDCSEHAVLFVALCRAAGLPARQVSGYAQVGEQWGSHAFTEIWLGKWIGADPTTHELGTRARYICFGWPNDPESAPLMAEVHNRTQGRMRMKTLSFEEGDAKVDLTKRPKRTDTYDPLSGLRLAKAPDGWEAETRSRTGYAEIEGPGVKCQVNVSAGMGDVPVEYLCTNVAPGASRVKFGDRPAARLAMYRRNRTRAIVLVPYRRRLLQLVVSLDSGADEAGAMKTLAQILAPTLE